MYEWRFFKKLPIENQDGFAAYIGKWRQTFKYGIEERSDLYIFLPPQYEELNNILGLKLRDIKYGKKKIQVKGTKLELKVRKNLENNQQELWEKIFQNKLQKKCKIPFKYQQNQQMQMSEQIQQDFQGQQMQQQLQQIDLEAFYQNQTVFTTDSENLKAQLLKAFDLLQKQFKQQKLLPSILNQYMEILFQSINDSSISLVLVDKQRSQDKYSEETLVRVRLINNNVDKRQNRNIPRFWVSCQFEKGNQLQSIDEQVLMNWTQKYKLPQEQQFNDYVISGYPEFLSKLINMN